MIITVDINVLLNVFQRREPFYTVSAHVVTAVEHRKVIGICPAHGITTLYYFVRKHGSKQAAENAMDQLLSHFRVGNLETSGWRDARTFGMDDYEDAVVAAVGKATCSDYIVTRNVGDFAGSPVPAIAPGDFLKKLSAKP